MQDLSLSRNARRVTGWADVIGLGGLGMTAVVFADNNNWAASGITVLFLAAALYLLGTAAYRLRVRTPGRAEVHSMLGLRNLDLSKDITVRRGRLNPAIVVVRAGRKRYRLNAGLGKAKVETWLRDAAAAKVAAN